MFILEYQLCGVLSLSPFLFFYKSRNTFVCPNPCLIQKLICHLQTLVFLPVVKLLLRLLNHPKQILSSRESKFNWLTTPFGLINTHSFLIGALLDWSNSMASLTCVIKLWDTRLMKLACILYLYVISLMPLYLCMEFILYVVLIHREVSTGFVPPTAI